MLERFRALDRDCELWLLSYRPGDDLKAIEKALDEEMTRLLTEGPTPAEINRVRTARLSGFINGLQRIGGFGGKSDILAQSEVYRGSPDAWTVLPLNRIAFCRSCWNSTWAAKKARQAGMPRKNQAGMRCFRMSKKFWSCRTCASRG